MAKLQIDMNQRRIEIAGEVISEGEWLSLDGTSGDVYQGQLDTMVPDLSDPWLIKLLTWADEFRRLDVWANADYPEDAARAREYGASGIGLCRTEHMLFRKRTATDCTAHDHD